MPLWSWHRSCCGGSSADDDGDCTGNSHSRHKSAGGAAGYRSPNGDDATCALVPQVGDGNAVNATTLSSASPSVHSRRVDKSLSVPQNFQMLTSIGRGSYGGIQIWLTRHTPSSQLMAVKRIDLEQCNLPFTSIQHEINMHRLLKHPNIVPLVSCFAYRNEIWMVLPLLAYGSCRDLLQAHFKHGLPEMAIVYIMKDLLQALEYLHSRGIIHRDVKASHLFIQSNGTICLSGLRHCFSMMLRGRRVRYVHSFPDFYVNSLNWASRELLEQNLAGYDTKSDIYSVGITACELANGVVPFQDMPLTQMLLSKIEGTTPRLLDVTTIPELQTLDDSKLSTSEDNGQQPEAELRASLLPYNRTFSPNFHSYIEACLAAEPQSRPTAASLSGHNFFKQIQRKSNPPPLTDLLKPIKPITASAIKGLGDHTIESLSYEITDMTVDNIEWTF